MPEPRSQIRYTHIILNVCWINSSLLIERFQHGCALKKIQLWSCVDDGKPSTFTNVVVRQTGIRSTQQTFVSWGINYRVCESDCPHEFNSYTHFPKHQTLSVWIPLIANESLFHTFFFFLVERHSEVTRTFKETLYVHSVGLLIFLKDII